MKQFEGYMLSEISRIATRYMDLAQKLQRQLAQLKKELEVSKKLLEERDRGWEAYCNEVEGEMKEKYDDIMGEMINDTNREDLL